MVKDAAWKRILGGVCGIGILFALLWIFKQRGVSGDDAQRGEEILVCAAAVGGMAWWIVKRRKRRPS